MFFAVSTRREQHRRCRVHTRLAFSITSQAVLQLHSSSSSSIGRRCLRRAACDAATSPELQNLALYSHLTVQQNLEFGRKGTERTTAVAELLGIGQLLDRYPAELSGGEQQRVALGRAIVRQPAVCCWTSRCRAWMLPCVAAYDGS